MTYLKHSSRPRKNVASKAFISGFVVLVIIISYFFPRFLPSVFYPITSLFWKSESSSLGFFATLGKTLQSKYSLIKENERLVNELASRDHSLLLLETLQSENEDLKTSFGRTGKGNFVLGTILARPPESPYDTLVIDAGSKDGIAIGDTVYAEGDVLLGDVSEVFSHESKIDLYSTPGRTTSVLVGTSTISAQATGKGGGNFSLIVPIKTPISEGALVTIPNMHAHTLGVVKKVSLDSSASLQTVLFISPINIRQIKFVEVDIKK